MKKLKPIIIVVVIIALITGGLYIFYRYNQSKKVADVVPMANEGMDGYWGDNIQSYGTVTSEKSQSAFIASGTEILSVNVAEGDHVNEGDVLMTVKKDSQDINGKTLQVQKAEQALKVEQLKLSRLENTTPSPEYMHSQYVYRDDVYVAEKDYVVTADSLTLTGNSYQKDDIVAVTYYSSSGENLGTTYYKSNGRDEETDADKINEIKAEIDSGANVTVRDITSTNSWLASIIYYDGESKKAVGEDTFSPDGKQIHDGKPKGPTPTELKRQIEEQQISLKRQDLAYRQAVNELEAMKNTTDNGEILAKVSGTVSKVQSKDNYNNTQPFIVVSATDEYYISGSIGEFYLDSVHVGDTVSISSWETGNSAEAVITSISDTPSTDGSFYSGSGNQNSSNYEFKASFDRNSGIDIGTAVDISITPAGQEQGGFYIPNHYVRKDSAGSYVMKMNADGILEKVYVKVGKSLWGSMIEIKEGVTKDDYLAFPYGNGEMEGVSCNIVEYLEY